MRHEKHISRAVPLIAALVLLWSAGMAWWQTSFTLAAVNTSKIPAAMKRFKEILNKNLDISVSGLNKNYVSSIGSLENTVPLKISNLKTAQDAGNQFLKEYGRYFGVANFKTDLKLHRATKDGFGQNYIFYRQRYTGVPVYGGELIVQVDDDFRVHAGSGKFIPGVAINTKPKISKNKAITLAKTAGMKNKMRNTKVQSIELVIYNPRLFSTKVKDKNYLAWNTILEDENGWMERVFFDANTSRILAQWPLVKTSWFDDLNIETRDLLGSDQVTRRVYDCQADGCTQDSTPDATVITDPATQREEGQAATGRADVDDLYDILGQAFDYYKTTFDYWGANGLGGMGKITSERWPLMTTTAYAYVVGTSTLGLCDNAWGGANKIMFCSGVVNTAAVGHEYQHAVSAFNKPDTHGFDYQGESGAIEEAYADIFGQAIMRYADGVSSWQVGPLPALWRNLIDPTNADRRNVSGWDCPCPIRQYGPEFDCSNNDHGGVHKNSTVVSHLAYTLSVGGNLNGCEVQTIGQEKMEKLFYHAFRHNLPSAPDFKNLYNGLLRSCVTIFGLWSEECRNVALAMQGAELDQDKVCGAVADSPACRYNAIDPRGFAQFGLKKIILQLNPPKDAGARGAANLDNSGADATIQPPVILPMPTPIPANIPAPPAAQPTPPAVSEPEEEVRTPSFSISLVNTGTTYTVTGRIEYFGKGVKCSGPRPYDPVIVRWGDGADEPAVVNSAFSSTHQYRAANKTYELSVSVYNSCYGMKTERRTVTLQ